MTLLGRLGLSPESAALEGTPDEVDARVRAAHDAKLRPARVEDARRVRGWREIEDDLVPRLGGRCSSRRRWMRSTSATRASRGRPIRPLRWPTRPSSRSRSTTTGCSVLRAHPASVDVV